MANLIAKREYKTLVKSSLFKFFLLISWVLFFFALWNGVNYYQENTEIRASSQNKTYQQWLNQEDKGPHSAAHYGFYAYKPVSLLSIMDKGMDDFLGTATWLEAHNQNEVIASATESGNSLIKYNSITIGFLWQFLFPLILMILGFNAITKEKENGTLIMLFSTGISNRYIFSGKISGILKAFLFLIFIPQFIVLLIAILLHADQNILREVLLLSIILGFYCILYLIITNLSVFLSSIFKTSSQVIVICISFWLITAFVLPRFYGSIVKQIYPTPSSYEFTEVVLTQREKGIDGKSSYEQLQEKLKDSLLSHYKVDKVEDLPIGFAGVSLEQREKRDYAAYDKNYGEIQKKFSQQDQFISIGALFSPLLSMRNISFGLSETDIYKHFDFANQAEKHRRDIATKMNNDIIKNGSSLGKKEGYRYNANKNLWKTVDNFRYIKPSIYSVLAHQWWNILTLFIWLAISIYLKNKAEQNLKPL